MSASLPTRDRPPDACAGGGFAVEPTAIGAQSLVPGVAPITTRDRLAFRAAAPLEPRKVQRACDHGLFDLAARAQLDLFQPPPSPRGATMSHPTANNPALADPTLVGPVKRASRQSPAEEI